MNTAPPPAATGRTLWKGGSTRGECRIGDWSLARDDGCAFRNRHFAIDPPGTVAV